MNDCPPPSRRGPPSYGRNTMSPQWSQGEQRQPYPPDPRLTIHENSHHHDSQYPPEAPQSSQPMATNGAGSYRRNDYNNAGGGGDYNYNNRHDQCVVPDRPISHAARDGGPENFNRNGNANGSNSNSIYRRNNHNDYSAISKKNSNNINGNNDNRKRAAKRRARHDLPGPVGVWFRQQKQKSAAKTALLSTKKAKAMVEAIPPLSNRINKPLDVQSNGTIAMENTTRTKSQESQLTADSITSDKDADNNNDNKNSEPQQQQTSQQLFHDYSADLHECNAWNLMCTALDRVVPPPNLLLQSHQNASALYRTLLRRNIPEEYAMISEIHEGRYDHCHLSSPEFVHDSDLRIPLLVGYVASVQCHAHSDWTALLVDEMHSVASSKNGHTTGGGDGGGGGGGSNAANAGRGILCWIEERLAKQHPGWVRPGVVWMLEGAKLALFRAAHDDEDEGDDETTDQNEYETSAGVHGIDISPSTDTARGGGNVDRMILVGETSTVYAWTPEEAASSYTLKELVDLTERRLNLGLPEDDVVEIDDGEADDSAGDVVVRKEAEEGSVAMGDDDGAVIVNASLGAPVVVPRSEPPSTNADLVSAGTPGSPDMLVLLSPNGGGTILPNEQINDDMTKNAIHQSAASNKMGGPAEESALEVHSAENNLTCEPMHQSATLENAHSNQQSTFTRPNPYAKQQNSKLNSALDDGRSVHSTATRSNPYTNHAATSVSNNPESRLETSSKASTPIKKQGKAARTEARDDDFLGLFQITDKTAQPARNNDSDEATEQTDKNTAQSLSTNAVSLPNPHARENNSIHFGASVLNNEQKSEETAGVLLGTSNKKVSSPREEQRETPAHRRAADDDGSPGLSQVSNKSSPRKTIADGTTGQGNENTAHALRSQAGVITVSGSKSSSEKKKLLDNENKNESNVYLLKSNHSFDAVLGENENPLEEATVGAISHSTRNDGSNEQHSELQIDTGDSFDDLLGDDEEDMICAGAIRTRTALSNPLEEATTGAISLCAPKDMSNKQNVELQVDTGDSFDDMLEEDEEDMLYAVTISTTKNGGQNSIMMNKLGVNRCSSTSENILAVQLTSTQTPNIIQAPCRETNTLTNNAMTKVEMEKTSAFDTLDGDDLDFLGEDD